MGRFRDLFKRRSDQPDAASQNQQSSEARLPGADVAHLQVAGMQRTNQGTYVTAYSSVKPSTAQNSSSDNYNASCSSSTTAVGSDQFSKSGESHWKGQPNGKPYDKRTELTEEDEDAWARMAM